MEVHLEDLKDFSDDFNFESEGLYHWKSSHEEESFGGEEQIEYSVLKQSLVSSPIVKNIYRIRYSISKKLEGLEDESSEDDGSIMTKKMMRELRRPNPDSFDMDIDDDLETEMLKYTSVDDATPGRALGDIEIDLTEEYEPELKEAVVLIRHSSILINNELEVRLPSTVRSSNVLRGSKVEESIWDEDSLIITLSSGYLLLIRLFLVDKDVKPYVVQWWKTSSSPKQIPTLEDVGRETLTHCSGSLVALTAAQGRIRVLHCTQTKHGVMFDSLQNINFDGNILHSCFLEPLKDVSESNHALIFSLVVTSHRRYMIRLFEFWLDQKHIMEHSPFLLTNEFDIPVFVLPIKQGVFLMMEKKIVIITVNQILSADYNFLEVDFDGAFPTGYYKPTSKIKSTDDDEEEVLISTEDGMIYSVVVVQYSIRIFPIIKVPKLSQFVLERVEEGFRLYYACSFGYGGYRLLPTLLSYDDNYKVPFDAYNHMEKVDNWAPLLDVEVVDTKDRQELWLANARSLSKLRYGYKAVKEIQDNKLRKAYKVFSHIFGYELYFIFSFFDKTLVFKYEDEQLIDVEESGLELVNRSIVISSFGSVCFQVLERCIIATDFSSENLLKKDLDDEVILADCIGIYVAIVTESIDIHDKYVNKLIIFESSGDIHRFGDEFNLELPTNVVKYFYEGSELFLAVAGTNFVKIFRKSSSGFDLELEFAIDFTDPNDVTVFSGSLLISSRVGEIASYDLKVSTGKLYITLNYKLKLSELPIEFHSTTSELFLICKDLWKLKSGEKYPRPVIFDEQKERTVYSIIKLTEEKYAVLREDGFSFVNISKHMQPILKSIKLSQVPKKVKYISHLGIFAIISESSLIFTNKLAKLETRLYSKRESQSLFEDETPLSLSEWVLPTNDKAFRNLLIGSTTSTGGSIKVLQPKFSNESKDVVEAYEIFSAKTDGPVLAFKQLSDDTIIYSSGVKLFTSKYDLNKKKMDEPALAKVFNALIMDIDVRDNTVLVSTKDYSVSTFQLKDRELHFTGDDYSVRKVTNSLLLNDKFIVSTDKLHCSVTGFQKNENVLKTFVSFLPFVPKVKRCELKPLWYEDGIKYRFITYGIGGDIQLYTFVEKSTVQSLAQHLSAQKSPPNTVTQKGLWELNDDLWVNDRNVNVIDGDKSLINYSSDVVDLLKAISF